MFQFLSNLIPFISFLHCSDETVGREMLIYLAQYLLDNYGIVPEVTNLVDTTDIWLMPSMNPDGYNRSKVRNCNKTTQYNIVSSNAICTSAT